VLVGAAHPDILDDAAHANADGVGARLEKGWEKSRLRERDSHKTFLYLIDHHYFSVSS
jgi:hypothetical protein